MKVLIVYATAGAGHRKAAEAVYHGLQSVQGVEPVLVDVLDMTNPIFKRLYSQSYTLMVTRLPWLWKIVYGLMDVPSLQPIIRGLRRFCNALNAGKFHVFLKEQQFDCIVSTHFLPNEVAGFLKRREEIDARLISIITDYDVHHIWLAGGIDTYVVASEWTARRLEQLGIFPSKIAPVGIPVDPKFLVPKDRMKLRQRLGLRKDLFTVLIATGSFGMGPMEEIMNALPDVQVIIVCGHNIQLYERLSAQKKELVKVCGLADNMEELMGACDLMITKPGGMSITESLVTGIPLVFFSAIPGQEENNVKVLKEHGIGVSGWAVKDLPELVRRYQNSVEEYQKARNAVRAFAKPGAVKEIINLIRNQK